MLLLQDGWTALHLACNNGHTEVAKCLLTNGANLSVTNKVGKLQNKFLHLFIINSIIKCNDSYVEHDN